MDIHFQSAGVSPDALTPKLLGVAVCMGKGGVSIPHCTEKNPGKMQNLLFPQNKYCNKSKDPINPQGNLFPYLFRCVSLPKVISSVLKGKGSP